jgi:hypothetical protein
MRLNILGEIELNQIVIGFIIMYLMLITYKLYSNDMKLKKYLRSSMKSGATGLIYGLAYSGTAAGGVKNAIIWTCIGGIKKMVIK